MRDVRKRAAVHERRSTVQGLNEIRMNGVAQQNRQRTGHLPGGDELLLDNAAVLWALYLTGFIKL